jgi:ketosteroid isomerase-like protein
MGNRIEDQIAEAEERLRAAMLDSDVSALDELLADELVFTNHLGHVLGKPDDLGAHQSGLVTIDALRPSEQIVLVHGEVAIVSVRVHLSGSYAGTRSEGDFRFMRVWGRSAGGGWQVVAGHACVVV